MAEVDYCGEAALGIAASVAGRIGLCVGLDTLFYVHFGVVTKLKRKGVNFSLGVFRLFEEFDALLSNFRKELISLRKTAFAKQKAPNGHTVAKARVNRRIRSKLPAGTRKRGFEKKGK